MIRALRMAAGWVCGYCGTPNPPAQNRCGGCGRVMW
jgi:transglutaminase-like putative cysteine protease